MHVGAVDRALPRRNHEVRLLELVLVQQCRIEIGDAECREVRCQPRRIGNLKRAVGGAGHQREARVRIENGRDIGKAALLRRVVVDRRPVRRRIFKSDVALEEPPGEEILGLADLAAILEARREGLSRAAIDAHSPAVEGIVAGLDVEHARGAQAKLRRQRAGDQRMLPISAVSRNVPKPVTPSGSMMPLMRTCTLACSLRTWKLPLAAESCVTPGACRSIFSTV